MQQTTPEVMMPLLEGYRHRVLASTYGGVAPRGVLIYSEHRRPQAQRTVDKQRLTQSTAEVKAFQKLCRTAFACEADAQQALSAFAQGLQATHVQQVTIRPRPRYAKRGRPSHVAPPQQVVYQIEGALASAVATHETLVARHSCFILATNELDEQVLSPQELLVGYKGQKHAERGFRFLKDPRFLASSLYLKKPQRIMALLMVMTVCLLVYAALEYRIRQALKTQQATFPNHKGQPSKSPRHGGSSNTLWGFICCACLGNGRWRSISAKRTRTCSDSSGNSTRHFIHKNDKGDAECRFTALALPQASAPLGAHRR